MEFEVVKTTATKHGFPTHMLRTALAAYRWPRYLRHKHLVSGGASATRGILAGGVFAMALVVAYLWDAVHAAARANPEVNIRFYVDYEQIQFVGPPAIAVEIMYKASAELFQVMEGSLRLVINKG